MSSPNPIESLPLTDPYRVAVEFALEQAKHDVPNVEISAPEQVSLLLWIAHWSAWRAARNSAAAMLNKAAELGVTSEQMQALTEVAEQTAYD